MEETLLQKGLLSGCHKLSVSSSGSEVSTAVAAILADTVSCWSIYFCGIFSLCIVRGRWGEGCKNKDKEALRNKNGLMFLSQIIIC